MTEDLDGVATAPGTFGAQVGVFGLNRVVWTEHELSYTTQYRGKVGKFVLFTYSWDGIKRDEDKPWRLTTSLPISLPVERFAGHEEVQEYAEAVIRSFVMSIGATWERSDTKEENRGDDKR